MSELEDRVTAIEERLGMEAGLRASQDRDLSSIERQIRAQLILVQAMHITQQEHNQKIDDLLDAAAEQGHVLSAHTAVLNTQGDAIETLRREHGHKLDQIVSMLTGLIEQ